MLKIECFEINSSDSIKRELSETREYSKYKMEIVNRVSAFQTHNFSDVMAERTKRASENSSPMKNQNKLGDCVSVIVS